MKLAIIKLLPLALAAVLSAMCPGAEAQTRRSKSETATAASKRSNSSSVRRTQSSRRSAVSTPPNASPQARRSPSAMPPVRTAPSSHRTTPAAPRKAVVHYPYRPGAAPARRVHPRDRNFLMVNTHIPCHYMPHNHYYGYRVKVLPAGVRRIMYRNYIYYCCDGIYYRPYGNYYVICRPPFGTVIAADMLADIAFTAVTLSYYNTVYNTYRTIDENNAYIAGQNEIIARNNAVIASQNQTIAMNQNKAIAAYTLADELGLVQSYASANDTYYYQDGVFYTFEGGEYRVIIPPAGAMVETIPDDYDIVTLGDSEYYKVDDTVYMITVSDGKPYFEVLGQMYN